VREPVAIATVTWHALWFVWTLGQKDGNGVRPPV